MKENGINKCYKIAWVLYLIYLIERPLLNRRSLDVFVMVVLTLILFWGVIINLRLFNFRDIIPFVIIGIVIIASLFYSGGNITLSLAKAVFCFFATYLLMVTTSKSIISKQTFDFIFICSIIASFIFIIYYFTPIAYVANDSKGEKYISEGFTCNLGNPNYTGIVLFVFFVILLINLRVRKNKLLIAVLASCLLYLIWQTKSRACLISVAVVVLFFVIFSLKQSGRPIKVNTKIIILFLLIPVLFIWLYLGLYYSGFKNIEVMNKSLFSGREVTYIEYLENISDVGEVLIGNVFKTQFNNAHNGPLAIYTSIGIIGLISVYVICIRSINRINKGTWIASICILCILGVFIHASVEAAFLVGGISSIVGLNSLFFLSSYNEKGFNNRINTNQNTYKSL